MHALAPAPEVNESRIRVEQAKRAVRRDRWIAFGITAVLHFAILAALAIGQIKDVDLGPREGEGEVVDTIIIDLAQEELPPEPEDVEVNDAPPSDDQPSGPLTASLPEPPSALSLSNAVADRVRPSPPVMPRPDGLSTMAVPVRRAVAQSGAGARPSGLANVFDAAQLDQQPMRRSGLNVIYPPNLRREGVSGMVVVRFIVTESGSVTEIQIVRSTHPEFATAVTRALESSRWTPGRKDGRIVNSRMEQPFPFRINDGE